MSDSLKDFNPFSAESLQCPYPHYQQMRTDSPVHYIEALNVYLVTRHDHVNQVTRDTATYSNKFGSSSMPLPPEAQKLVSAVMAEGYPRVSTMLTADAPQHTRYRRLVAKAFTPRAISEIEPDLRRITQELIGRWVQGSGEPIEFVSSFAVPLPVRAIAKVMNIPDDRLADFKRWSDNSIAGTGTSITVDQRCEAERGVNEFQRYFAEEIEQRRQHPQDDFLTNLLNARFDSGDNAPGETTDNRPLELPEMLSIIQQLLVAGNETTTKLLTEIMRLLGDRPDEWVRLQDDRSRIPLVIEEALRLLTPTQGMWRVTTREVELGGVTIPSGQRIILAYGSANRDETVFAEPDLFNPDRPSNSEHLAFGKGIHFCIGASLSRLEARIALEELLTHIKTFTLADSNDFLYHPSFMLRGLVKLDLNIVPKLDAGKAT
jgi:cytochrome P450